MLRLRSFVAAIVAAYSLGLPICGAALLDQAYIPTGPSASAFSVGSFDRAQTFTVGATGLLSGIDLLLFRDSGPDDALLVDVRTAPTILPSTPNDGPDVVASALIPAASIPLRQSGELIHDAAGWVHVDLTGSAASVVAGTRLAIVLRSPAATGSPGAPQWVGNIGGSYPGGMGFGRPNTNPPTAWTIDGSLNIDQGFRSYVAIPEHSTLTLTASLLGCLCLRARRLTPLAGCLWRVASEKCRLSLSWAPTGSTPVAPMPANAR